MLNLKSSTLKFSVSGMRGIVPDDLNTINLPYVITAFEKTLPKGKIAIARDTRRTGEFIENIALGVLSGLGREVTSLGITPTPTIKAAIKKRKFAGGLMISASHNPPEYNAFKFIKKEGLFFSEKENNLFLKNLDDLQKKAAIANPKQKTAYLPGIIHYENSYPNHKASIEHVNSVIEHVLPNGIKNKIKVAIDPVSAAASKTAPILLEALNIPYVSIHSDFQPKFPRKPEPIPSALKKLGKLVVENHCDIGFAFDPDADRLALVGPDGKPLGEEYTLALAMKEFYEKNTGPVVINLSTSWMNETIAKSYGQKIYRSKVGEANVVSLMKKKKALFGGEGNGGIIDARIPSFGRDSISAMAYILASLDRRPLYETLQSIPPVVMQKNVIKLENDTNPSKTVNKIVSIIKKEFPQFQLNTEDGYRFSGKDGIPWIHIRSSNTEPIIRIIIEASNKKDIHQIESTLNNKI